MLPQFTTAHTNLPSYREQQRVELRLIISVVLKVVDANRPAQLGQWLVVAVATEMNKLVQGKHR
jgi:hypothetical protein